MAWQRWAYWVAGASLLVGCAGSRPTRAGSTSQVPSSAAPNEPAHPAVTPKSQRLYAVGEVAYIDGHFGEAASLFRQAMLALPPTRDADDLRHALILRIAHTQLRAWDSTGSAAYLEDAESMLLRYADRHEALFGTGPEARAERGDVYELLYSVEAALAPEPDDAASDDVASEDATSGAAVVAEGSPDDHAGEVVDGENVRQIRVKQRRLARLDDPNVRARLTSSFSTGRAGLLMTNGIEGKIHGPRPLVRFVVNGLDDDDNASPEARQWARRAGRQLVLGARPALRECYRSSYARSPTEFAHGSVAIDIDAEGKVADARMREGGLDAIGNACVETRLSAIESEEAPGEPRRLVVSLTFFYEGAKFLQGTPGGTTGRGLEDGAEGRKGGLPDIDTFNGRKRGAAKHDAR